MAGRHIEMNGKVTLTLIFASVGGKQMLIVVVIFIIALTECYKIELASEGTVITVFGLDYDILMIFKASYFIMIKNKHFCT